MNRRISDAGISRGARKCASRDGHSLLCISTCMLSKCSSIQHAKPVVDVQPRPLQAAACMCRRGHITVELFEAGDRSHHGHWLERIAIIHSRWDHKHGLGFQRRKQYAMHTRLKSAGHKYCPAGQLWSITLLRAQHQTFNLLLRSPCRTRRALSQNCAH